MKLKTILARESDSDVLQWAKMELSSVAIFLWTGFAVLALELLVLMVLLRVRRSDNPPNLLLIGAVALVVTFGGLIVSAIKGTKAEKFRKQAGVEKGLASGGCLLQGVCFGAGWCGYWIPLAVLKSAMQK